MAPSIKFTHDEYQLVQLNRREKHLSIGQID